MNQKTSDFTTTLCIDGTSVEAVDGGLKSGRARGATLRGILSFLMAAILVSGCAAAYAPAPLPVNHPASPAASEAPPPPPSQAFKGESILPAPAEEAPAQGPHSGHSAMPGRKNIPPTPVEEMPAQGPHSGHSAMQGGH